MSPDPGVWVLAFEPLPGDVPAEVRVRRLLKIAKRSLKLKCVHVGVRDVQPVVPEPRPRKPKKNKKSSGTPGSPTPEVADAIPPTMPATADRPG